MIFIIRALSHVRKGWWRLRTKKKRPKKWEKKREGTMLLSISTLVLQSSTLFFHIEILLCCHFHILVGIFHYRTWLVYSNDGLPQISLSLREQASWMHTHLVFFFSFHTLIALVHLLHGNPCSSHWYRLMGLWKCMVSPCVVLVIN